jgi:hypothetical protein
MDGHPTMFMKILHYVLFYSSNAVRNYLYSKEIDPLTIHMNDYKFMEKMFYILVSAIKIISNSIVYFEQTNLLGLKPRISIQQFFKYGYAEQKMMMCVEAIQRTKSLAKEIRVNQSLTSSRKMT